LTFCAYAPAFSIILLYSTLAAVFLEN